MCQDYDLEKEEKIRRLFRYCDFINEQYVRVVVNANVFNWKKFCKTLCKDYKNKNLNQQLHSLKYLEILKNKMRTSLKKIFQYCRQYTIIFEKLIKTKKLQKTLRSVWFFQRLLEKFSENLVIRSSLKKNDENKMRFENLIKQILQLIKSRNVIIKTRKTNYKTKKTTTLIKKMKSIIKKNVNEHLINLLKTMKSRIEESILKIDVKLDDLIEVMRKIMINVDNLINCVFFFRVIETILNRIKIINRICLRVILLQISRLCSTQSHSQCFFKICLFRTCCFRICSSHFSAMKSRDHLRLNVFIVTRKIICTKENASSSMRILKLKKIHLQKKRIHLDFYNFDVFHVRMISYKNQRQCVKNVEKLTYSNRVVAISVEVHTIRLKKNAKLEFFMNKKKKEAIFVNHEFYANVDIILIAARSEFKISRKLVKHHEFIKRILRRKMKKKEKLFISKILRSRKWKNIIMKKENDVQNQVMKKISQKNVQKKKKSSKRRKNVRDSFSTKKKVKSSKWSKKWKKFKKSLRCLRAKKLRISFESSTFENMK